MGRTILFSFVHPASAFGVTLYEVVERPAELMPISVLRVARAGELGDTPFRGQVEMFPSFEDAEMVLRKRHPDFQFTRIPK